MNQKWYLSTLIVILTLIGVVSQQQISVPNQEIVLQFTDVGVTTEEAQNTLEIVKKQLQDLGAENIQIKEDETGGLKIIYYSDSDVAIIKDTLSKEKSLALYKLQDQGKDTSKFPSDRNNIPYHLEVHEIQKGQDVNWVLNGTFVSQLKTKSQRFLNSNVLVYFTNTDFGTKEDLVKVTYIISRNIAIAIDNSSRNIPEVRAGPIC